MGKCFFVLFYFLSSGLALAAGPQMSRLDYLGPVEGVLDFIDEKSLPQTGFTELLPYIQPSPDQEDAGSCLYMATTGIVEWWLGRLHPEIARGTEGEIDLSERFTMNMAEHNEAGPLIKDWRTDTILGYNAKKQAVKNKDYRYTKGFYKEQGGSPVPAEEGESGAQYGPYFNWIDQSAKLEVDFVKLPKFKRHIIFADPEHNQWNTGVTPADIVEQVKEALSSKKAPVMVIYNHYGYWHAVNIFGFDDEAPSKCQMTQDFGPRMLKQSKALMEQALRAEDVEEKELLTKRAQKYAKMAVKAQKRLEAIGGCAGKGVFYVRDSIYPDEEGPVYDYDPTRQGEEGPYVKRVILREYEWLKVLANHLIQVTVSK